MSVTDVISVLECLIEVSKFVRNELKKIKDIDKAVEKLETSIAEAERLLSADKFLFEGEVVGIRKQIDSLIGVYYDTEDVLSEVLLITRHNSSLSNRVDQLHAKHSLSRNIRKLQRNIDDYINQMKVCVEGTRNKPLNVAENKNDQQNFFFGRENDVSKIIDLLLSKDPKKGVSIAGLDGLGKTTLAHRILRDARINQEFSMITWVDVSNEGDFKKDETIARLVTERSKHENKPNMLIVLDNLLELKYSDWDSFLSDNSIKDVGKKFLITTSNPIISDLTNTHTHNLSLLSNDFCKELIIKKARCHKSNLSDPWLSHIAGKLAEKCEGLPFVAEIMGAVLAAENEDNWNILANKRDLWEWQCFDAEFWPVLSSSYKNMQYKYKRCFAYFSLFPENYCFKINDLIQHWVGEEFIKFSNSASSLEEIGKSYINELRKRAIFQVHDGETQSTCTGYKLHKFTHKFAGLVASNTCLRFEDTSTLSNIDKDIRHLSLLSKNLQSTMWTKVKKLKNLRTILFLYDTSSDVQLGEIPYDFFTLIKYLRVLALRNTKIKNLPESIIKLKHLQYLDVSHTSLSTLPNNLSKLSSLHILKFSNSSLSVWPKDLQFLTSLLCLDWEVHEIRRIGLPPKIGNICNLETLPLFPVGQKIEYSIIELRNMNCIKGSIRIENLERVKNREEANAANLDKKTSLEILELIWNENTSSAKEVLIGLRPPKEIKELKIENYGCDSFPEWISGSNHFPRLHKIHLHKCHSCTILPVFRKLPALKTLILHHISSLETVDFITSEDGNFPSLKTLVFIDMPLLQQWTGLRENDMPLLEELKLVNCPVMSNLPSLINPFPLKNLQIHDCKRMVSLPNLSASLESLQITGNYILQIHCENRVSEWPKLKSINGIHIQIPGVSSNPIPSTSTPLA